MTYMAFCRVMEQGETWGRDLATLVGDAAHPTTPALGQGGCMALEVLHSLGHSSLEARADIVSKVLLARSF